MSSTFWKTTRLVKSRFLFAWSHEVTEVTFPVTIAGSKVVTLAQPHSCPGSRGAMRSATVDTMTRPREVFWGTTALSICKKAWSA